jgi:hypothetical protein
MAVFRSLIAASVRVFARSPSCLGMLQRDLGFVHKDIGVTLPAIASSDKTNGGVI